LVVLGFWIFYETKQIPVLIKLQMFVKKFKSHAIFLCIVYLFGFKEHALDKLMRHRRWLKKREKKKNDRV